MKIYSRFEVKSIDSENRIVTGMATTPSTDQAGDVVEPNGAEFSLPLPFLWQHDLNYPIGEVISAVKSPKGIEIKAKIAKALDPESLRNKLDEVWGMIKIGLVKGLSIGFAPVDWSILNGGGVHYKKWRWYELSAVTVPTNVEATITAIKKFDHLSGVASYAANLTNKSKTLSGDAGDHQIGKNMTIEEQIKDFEAVQHTKSVRMNEIMQKSGAEGRTLDVAESEEYDELQTEITSVGEHLRRLTDLRNIQIRKSTPVAGMTTKEASDARGGQIISHVPQKLEKGIEFARYVQCLGSAKGDLSTAYAIAQKRFPGSDNLHVVLKAAVEAGTTTDAGWAGVLVQYNQFAGDFVEFLRPMTIIGRFGLNGIPSLRRVPFNIHIRGTTGGGSGYWVGQGAAKPLTKFAFNDTYLAWAKVANIAVITEDLLRHSNPSAETLVRDLLAQALVERLDIDFVDPAKALVANVSPASITNGVTPIMSSGTDADAVRADIHAVMSEFIAANIMLSTGVWIMSAVTALSLTLMRNALGQREFPDINMMGGMFEGLPVIVSEYVPQDSTGYIVILVNASDIWLSDDNQVIVDMSREASLEMDSTPSSSSATPTETTMVSMFQTNSMAIRAERYINWMKRRAKAVSVISGVNWSAFMS